MAKSIKIIMQQEYSRLKKAMEKIIKPGKKNALPQLALQPVREKKFEK